MTADAQPVRVRPAFSRHVRERAVAVVLVEAIGRARGRALQPRAAQDEQVEPAVVVVVEERHPAPDHLEDVALGVDAAVDDGVREAGLLRDVGEAGEEGAAGRHAARLGPDPARRDALGEGAGAGSGAREQGQHPAARDHRAGSLATTVWPAATFSIFWTMPEGQRISTRSALAAPPRPTRSGPSLAER